MQTDQNGEALVPVKGRKTLYHQAGGFRIKRSDRLVGQDDPGALLHGTGNGGALLLAS